MRVSISRARIREVYWRTLEGWRQQSSDEREGVGRGPSRRSVARKDGSGPQVKGGLKQRRRTRLLGWRRAAERIGRGRGMSGLSRGGAGLAAHTGPTRGAGRRRRKMRRPQEQRQSSESSEMQPGLPVAGVVLTVACRDKTFRCEPSGPWHRLEPSQVTEIACGAQHPPAQRATAVDSGHAPLRGSSVASKGSRHSISPATTLLVQRQLFPTDALYAKKDSGLTCRPLRQCNPPAQVLQVLPNAATKPLP